MKFEEYIVGEWIYDTISIWKISNKTKKHYLIRALEEISFGIPPTKDNWFSCENKNDQLIGKNNLLDILYKLD